MYESFFGLSELPFELTTNPKYLFLRGRQQEALSTLQYGLFSAKPLTLLTGEAGTGKTTLIRSALASDRCRNVRCVYLDNPLLKQEDFVRLLAYRFGLGEEVAGSKALLLERLYAVLHERRARGEITALVVDEAQSLSTALLEEVRLLANLETHTEKLLPLVLAGQPELASRLEAPELRQLKQRVTLRCVLAPFEAADTATYIASRIQTAGGSPSQMFTQEAVLLIHECSRGIPRSINVICDNALLSAMGLGRKPVDRSTVVEVCRELRLMPGPRAPVDRPDVAPQRVQEPPPLQSETVSAAGEPIVPQSAPRRLFGRLRNRSGSDSAYSPPSTRIVTE